MQATKDTVARWFVDAAFAVHPDQKSHTGYYMTLGSGAVISSSKKQKLNTRSSTEAELVATDDAASPMLWTSRFLHEQGYDVKTIFYQDNRSAILMESNGCSSGNSSIVPAASSVATSSVSVELLVLSLCFLLALMTAPLPRVI